MSMAMRAHFARWLSVLMLASAPAVTLAQESLTLTRQDQKPVAATLYAPKRPAGNAQGTSCLGVAIISHGAGGSEKGYAYLAEAMAAQGYLAMVVGHQESGIAALREHMQGGGLRDGLAALIIDPQAYRGRLMDIAAARALAQTRCAGGEAILLGHSMGAATVMIEAGARNKVGVAGSNTFDAYVALSPQGVGTIFPPDAWAGIRRPVLLLTGTRDTELGGASWESRTDAFKNLPAGCAWLGVIDGATHMHFGGRGGSRDAEALTTATIEAFLAGVHRADCKAPPKRTGIELQAK